MYPFRNLLLACMLGILFLVASPNAGAQSSINSHGFFATYPGAMTAGLTVGPSFIMGMGGPTGSCNCEYDGGSGVGYNVGIALDVRLNNLLALRLQGLFESHSSVFTKDVSRNLFASDGAPVAAVAERRFESDLQYSSVSMHMLLFTGLGDLFVSLGAGAGFYVDGTATDQETLKTPGVFYQQGSNQVIYHDGSLAEISETSLRAAVILGFGYDFPLTRGFAMAPEIQVDVPLSSVTVEDGEWKQLAIRCNVAFRLGV